MAEVFISYSRRDKDFVRRLGDALVAHKREAWVDWKDIPLTAEWQQEIFSNIEAADNFIFIISPDSIASTNCKKEIDHASANHKRMMPIFYRPVPDDEIPDALGRFQRLDFDDSNQFEINFETLTKALDTDLPWTQTHTRLLTRAKEWEREGNDRSFLLHGKDLGEAEQWMAKSADREPKPTALQSQYILASRQLATKTQRIVIGAVAVALVVAVGLAIYALVKRDDALRETVIANDNATEATRQKKNAEDNADEATRQRNTALKNEAEAKKQEGIAQKQRDLAIRRENEARARQLAARAEFLQQTDPATAEKSALIASESLRRLPNFEADQVLRHVIGLLPPRLSELRSGQTVAFGVSGSWMALVDIALASETLTLRVVDLSSKREVRNYPLQLAEIERVAISNNGQYVAIGGGSEVGVQVFDEVKGRRIHFDCNCHRLAFSGRNDYLLMACERDVVTLPTTSWENPLRMSASESVVAVASRPSEDQVAALTSNGDIYIWAMTGREISHIQGQSAITAIHWNICCDGQIEFSSNGKYLAAVNRGVSQKLPGSEIRVIDTSTWKLFIELHNDDHVNVFAFSEGSDLFVTGDVVGRIRIWDLKSRSLVSAFAHNSEVTSVHFARRNIFVFGQEPPLVVSTATDRTARLWSSANGHELARIGRPTTPLWASLVNDRFVTLDDHGFVEFRESETNESPYPITGQSNGPPTLATCSTRDALILVSVSGAVILTPQAAARSHFRIEGFNKPSVVFSPDCRWVVSGGDKSLDVREIKSGTLVHSEKGGFAGDKLAFSASGRYFEREPGYGLKAAELWDTRTWNKVALDAACKPRNIQFSPDERHIEYDCNQDLVIKDTKGWWELERTRNHFDQLQLLSHDHAVAVEDHSIRVYDIIGMKVVHRANLPDAKGQWKLIVSPNGGYLAAVGNGRIIVWRSSDLQEIANKALPGAESARFSPDEKYLLAATWEGAKVWRTQPWGLQCDLAYQGLPKAAVFDASNQLIVIVVHYKTERLPDEYTARVWDVNSGNEIARATLQHPSDSVTISLDRRYLLADQVYILQPSELIAEVCKRVSRNLSTREWSRETGTDKHEVICPALPVPEQNSADF